MNNENNIPKNKAIPIKEAAEIYRDPNGYPIYPAATKAAAKPQNEVKRFNDALKEALYLANMEKPEISKYAEFPKTFFDR